MSARTFLFVGVGGQGVLSAARFLGEAAFRKGLPTSVSQLHGMSQRGGSVQAAVTLGSEQPLSAGPVEMLVGMELIEAVRASNRLAPKAEALCNQQLIPPSQAALHHRRVGDAAALAVELAGHDGPTYLIQGRALAEQAGNAGALNAVMLGAFSRLPGCPVTGEELLAAMLSLTPPRAREINLRAFTLGREVLV